jgi:hypothetical protein
VWAAGLGTASSRAVLTRCTEPGMMGPHGTGLAGAGTSIEECGR